MSAATPVPTLSARARTTSSGPLLATRGAPLGSRVVVCVVGAVLLFAGVGTTIAAGLGVGAWQVLETGLAAATGAPLGLVVTVESLVALALAWGLGQRPGVVTGLMAVLGGPAIGMVVALWPADPGVAEAALRFAVGVVMMGLGVGIYVTSGLGASAQDGIFLGLHQRFGWSIFTSRVVVDASVLTAGWLLGGQVGVGTVLATLVMPRLVVLGMDLGTRWLVEPARR